MADVQITHRPDETRFVAEVDGAPAGFGGYQRTDNLYGVTHTEVDRAHEGLGVGGALARAALDHVRAEGRRRVLPVCPFIEGWMARHPDYADLHFRSRSTATD